MIYPYHNTLLQIIQSRTPSYDLQKQDPIRINISFLVYYAMHAIFRSKIPANQVIRGIY